MFDGPNYILLLDRNNDELRWVLGLRREPVVAVKNPSLIPTRSWQTPTLSLRRTHAQNSQREGRSLPRQGRDNLFQRDVGISVGFFVETTGSLRNPETRHTPIYVRGVFRFSSHLPLCLHFKLFYHMKLNFLYTSVNPRYGRF